MNTYEKKIMDMYVEEQMGKCIMCMKCREADSNLSHPISLWYVGENYEKSQYKVLFVGKTAVGSIDEENIYCDTVEDATEVAADLYNSNYSPFWAYTKSIADELYGEGNGWTKLALSNMVKCNSSDGNNKTSNDNTTGTAKDNCTYYLRKELEILSPEHIVFYTNEGYDAAIKSLFDSVEEPEYNNFPCGKKIMYCWMFTGILGGQKIRIIRTGHPERMNKVDFTDKIIYFIHGN